MRFTLASSEAGGVVVYYVAVDVVALPGG